MTVRLDTDPAFALRRLEKALLMLRFVWRFPRRGGAWPKYEYLKPWLAALEPAAVVDVGANLGQFLHLAHRLWPKAAIIGVEPAPALCARLEAAYRGDPRVRLHCCAAGAGEREAAFYVTRNPQNSSLHRPAADFSAERPGDGLVATETVAVRRMDRLLAGVAGPLLVKIDVQGAELEVLEGFGARLADVAVLIVEAPFERAYEGAAGFDAIYRWLTARGFAYRGALGQLTAKRSGAVRQEDSVYVRRDAVEGAR